MIYLDDYHWTIIISTLSYVDKLSLAKTSKRFLNLIQTKQIIYLEEQYKKFYISQNQIEDVINEFIRKFKVKYSNANLDQCERLYLEYFFFYVKTIANS